MDTIKEWRKKAGFSQAKMAEVMKIPKRTIENWETGKNTPPEYVEILVIEKLQRIVTEQQKTNS